MQLYLYLPQQGGRYIVFHSVGPFVLSVRLAQMRPLSNLKTVWYI